MYYTHLWEVCIFSRRDAAQISVILLIEKAHVIVMDISTVEEGVCTMCKGINVFKYI